VAFAGELQTNRLQPFRASSSNDFGDVPAIHAEDVAQRQRPLTEKLDARELHNREQQRVARALTVRSVPR
jgi:hypothetical protein